MDIKKVVYIFLVCISMSKMLFAADLYVGTCETPSYSTIQDAVDAADSGDTIHICDGTYTENLSISNKNLTIAGYSNDPTKVIIQNNTSTNTIIIGSNIQSISFSGITFKNTKGQSAMYSSQKPNNVTINNLKVEGNGSNGLYFKKGIGTLNITNTAIENKLNNSTNGIYIDGNSDGSISMDNVSIDADGMGFWVSGVINNGISIKNSSFKSKYKNGIYFASSVNGSFSVENVEINTSESAILVNGVINNGFNIKSSNLYSEDGKAIYFEKTVNGNVYVDSSNLEGDFGLWIDGGNVNNSILISNTTIKANRDVAIKVWNTVNGSISIDNCTISAPVKHAVQLNKIQNNLTIKNSKIDSGTGENGVKVFDKISGSLLIDNSEIHSGETALVFNKEISNQATITSSIITSDNSKGAVFSDNIWNGLRIDNSTFIAKSNALDLQSSKTFNPYITNSYFESSDDTAVSANLQQWTGFNANGNCFKTKSGNTNKVGLYLSITNSNNININNNCFYAPTLEQLAKSNREGYNWSGNYWDGLTGSSYNYDKIVDNNPLPSCPNSCGDQTTAIIADYHFDECSWNGTAGEVKDNSTNGYHGTSHNGANTLDNETAGGIVRVGYFDGVNDYVEIPQAAADVLKGTASLSFWIKTTQTGNNTDWAAPGVIGIEQDGGTNDIFWGWLDASGHIGVSKGNNGNNSKSTKAINDDIWHHIVLTRNSSNGDVKIYIDGVLDKSGKTDNGVVGNSFNKIGVIGNTNASVALNYFKGYLDEIKIYNYILTDSQVQAIYNNEKNGKNWDSTTRDYVNCIPELNSCFIDNFNRNELGSKWKIIKNENFTPTANGERLVLTNYTKNISAGLNLKGTFPSQNNFIEVEFKHFAYPKDYGADGIAVVLSDAVVEAVAGAYGGSLGYAQRSGRSGFAKGWIGIGLDEFGNFSACTEGRDGGETASDGNYTDKEIDSVAIRGHGDNMTGYKYLAGTTSLNPAAITPFFASLSHK